MATSSCSMPLGTSSGFHNYMGACLVTNNELPNILRELLFSKVSPYILEAQVNNNKFLSKKLRREEWLIIGSVRENMYNGFGVPLMYKIIRYLQLVPSPTKGWGSQPLETEVSIGDDIERIRRIREDFLHRENIIISDSDIVDYFSTFKNIASRIEMFLMKTNREFVSKIETIETFVISNRQLPESTTSMKSEIGAFNNNFQLLMVDQRFKMHDYQFPHFQDKIHHQKQEGMLPKTNRENLLICDKCNVGIVNSVCTICETYFCKSCFTKEHLFTFHDQVFIQQGIDPKNIEVRCNKHDKDLLLFCFDHDKPVCMVCVLEDHKKCKVFMLEDAVEKIDLNNRQSKLYSSFQNFISEINETKETVCRDLNSIEDKRDVFFAETENIEQQISTKVLSIKEDAMKKIFSHEKKMQTAISEIDERKGRVNEMVEEFHKIVGISSKTERLVYIHKLEQLLKINHKNFQKMLKRESIATIDPKFRFDLHELHDAIIDLDLRPIRRHLFLNKCNIKLKKISSFKLKEKTNLSFVRGCAVLPNGILCFTDDTEGLFVRYASGVIKTFELPCSPVDITYIGENRIAVTLRKRRSVGIITLNEDETEKIQSKEYMFKDIGSIRSLSYDGDNIIIQIGSFGFYKVDHTGNIKEKVAINDEINIQYVSCRNEKIYYTKWDTNTIICCDGQGNVLWDFQDSKILKSPIGIAVDEKENVFATGLYSNNVIAISKCGNYGVELLNHSENINRPHVIDYSTILKQLIVCSSSGDVELYLVDATNVIE